MKKVRFYIQDKVTTNSTVRELETWSKSAIISTLDALEDSNYDVYGVQLIDMNNDTGEIEHLFTLDILDIGVEVYYFDRFVTFESTVTDALDFIATVTDICDAVRA